MKRRSTLINFRSPQPLDLKTDESHHTLLHILLYSPYSKWNSYKKISSGCESVKKFSRVNRVLTTVN